MLPQVALDPRPGVYQQARCLQQLGTSNSTLQLHMQQRCEEARVGQ
jgi:hypothetical protein